MPAIMASHFRPSDTQPGLYYRLDELSDGTMTCTCKSYAYRHAVKGGQCKHIERLVAELRRERAAAAAHAMPSIRTATAAMAGRSVIDRRADLYGD